MEIQSKVSENLVNENKRLRKEIKSLDDRFSALAEKVDENEQHDRNINLILKGVPEGEREDTTKKFVEAINKHYKHDNQLKISDIRRIHRLGKRKTEQTSPRPIIARFSLETKKMDVFREKKQLAKKGISLAENLTSYRAGLYKKARELLGFRKVWTWEGRIFAVEEGTGRKFSISSFRDIPGFVGDEEAGTDIVC